MTQREGPPRLRRWIGLAALVGLLLIMGLLVRDRAGVLGTKPSEIRGPYPTEERWLVGEITRDVAEMVVHAKGRDVQSVRFEIAGLERGKEPRARISVSPPGGPTLNHELEIRRFVWSPEDYAEYATAVMAALDLRPVPASAADDGSLLDALLNPQARVIESQNQRVGELLSRNLLDPVAHEQAALVIGALALREASGWFGDVRQLSSRMTAHLALSRALRGSQPTGISGRYAEVILLTLSGRCRDAVDAIARLREEAGASDVQQRWLTTLTMRNTGDWRALRLPQQASLLERLEYFRDVAAAMNTTVATDFYQQLEPEPVTDWGRIAMGEEVGASAGSLFGNGSVERELEEASDVFRRVHSKEPAPDALIAALNEPAGRCLTRNGPRPLAWGTWAAFLARHLCHQIMQRDHYLRVMQGLADAADAEIASADAQFRPLHLYASARIDRAGRADKTIESIRDALDDAIDTMIRTPELLDLAGWRRVTNAARYAPLWKGAPDENVWFSADPRFASINEIIGLRRRLALAKQDLQALEALLAANPFNHTLKGRILELRYGKNPTARQVEDVFAEESPFSLGALYAIAWPATDDPPRRRVVLARICELWTDGCLDLADQLVQDGLDDEAAKAYEHAIEKASDRVWVSNDCRWLMRRYYEKRRFDRARAIAKLAADVGSARGLDTMGEFLEREGTFDEAQEYYAQVQQRYGDDSSLLAFYYRRARIHDDKSYEGRLAGLLGKVFPGGLAKLEPAQLPKAPTDGVEIRGESPTTRRLGLGRGDIVVAVNGWRVRTFEQYSAVRHFELSPEVELHAWHAGRYVPVKVRSPDGDLGVTMITLGSRP